MSPDPLVTIGIPTYNRPAELERAISSALAQDYRPLEVLVSDNASTDPGVARLAERLAGGDTDLRFVRQPQNRGHAANFQWLLENARGEYFMWLADDDWIDPGYVSSCIRVLSEDWGAVSVCGLGRYYRDGRFLVIERPIDLVSPRPGLRIIRYFARVSSNGALFGVARRQALLDVGFREIIGGDWLLVAALAARGRVRTVAGVGIHRSVAGLGAETPELARSFGLRGLAARQHHLLIAARTWRDIAIRSPLFSGMRPSARLITGTAAAGLIVLRFPAVDLVRSALGPALSARLESGVSAWLRRREPAIRELAEENAQAAAELTTERSTAS